ncbi:hypothetical protein A2V82_03330 [candidate division KSB1 bacterium RBG_16_48_16]|nr:MAG: hypothetical protein A2V82_03330 [candidate division KSB1 bacterium RBG_16_48_16]
MSYAVRNTLIISIFWTILIGVGFYYHYGHQVKRFHAIDKERKEKAEKLENLRVMEVNLIEMYHYYDRLIEISEGKKGVLASAETPGETYDYIVRELKRSGSGLEVSLSYRKTDSLSSVEKRTYDLEGNSKFDEFYQLLWYLENGPVFYSIKSMEVSKIAEEKRLKAGGRHAEIEFNMVVEGFNKKAGPDIREMAGAAGEPIKLAQLVKMGSTNLATNVRAVGPAPKSSASSSFKSVKSANPDLPSIASDSRILAITPNSVLIKLPNGKFVKIRKGDKINGGYLREISTQTGKAIFDMSGLGSLVLTVSQ